MAVWTSAKARATRVGAGLVARTSARVCSSHFSTTLSLGDGPHWLKLNSDFGPIGIPDPGGWGGLEAAATAGWIGPGPVTTSAIAKPAARAKAKAKAKAPLRFLGTRRTPRYIWAFASSAEFTRVMTAIAKAMKAPISVQAAAHNCVRR